MKNKGFTLTEVMVVLAIVAILTAVAVPTALSLTRKAGLAADESTARSLENAIYEWMNTDYDSEDFYHQNLYNSINGNKIGNALIDGKSEQMYAHEYSNSSQLPGIEFSNESFIRHSVIVALKSVSAINIVVENFEQFIEKPKTASDYGFKYYYKIGRVNVEKTDGNESTLGNDEVYKYFVWLDRTGGNIDVNVIPKQIKNEPSYNGSATELCSFRFNFGARQIENLRVEIEEEGKQTYSFEATAESPCIFKPGIYNIRLFERGDLCAELKGVNFTGNGDLISF